MIRSLAPLATIVFALTIASASVVQADDPPKQASAEVSPETRRLLDHMAKAYKALPRYADAGEVRLETVLKPGGPAEVRVIPARVALDRPGRVAIDAGFVRIIDDGKTIRTVLAPLAMYRDLPATSRVSLDLFADGPLASAELGSPQGRPLRLILTLLLGDDPIRDLVADARTIRSEKTSAEGREFDRITYVPQVGSPLAIRVDAVTRLIDRIDVDLSGADSKAELVPGNALQVGSLAWVSGPIRTDGFAEGTFDLPKPDGYREVARLARDNARKKLEGAGVDRPSPDFRLSVIDGPGKTTHLSKSDLLGKVVVLDFWATWCGPCLAELPDIAAIASEAAKRGDPVAIVAISIDRDEDGDEAALRNLVESTLKARSIAIGGSVVGRVALDPSSTVARAFGVEAIPHVVILDAKGMNRATHVGVTSRETLVGEIDRLIAEAKMKTP